MTLLVLLANLDGSRISSRAISGSEFLGSRHEVDSSVVEVIVAIDEVFLHVGGRLTASVKAVDSRLVEEVHRALRLGARSARLVHVL